jgi:hypothetical protein
MAPGEDWIAERLGERLFDSLVDRALPPLERPEAGD